MERFLLGSLGLMVLLYLMALPAMGHLGSQEDPSMYHEEWGLSMDVYLGSLVVSFLILLGLLLANRLLPLTGTGTDRKGAGNQAQRSQRAPRLG